MTRVFIEAVEYYLPDHRVTNDELEQEFPSWNPKRAQHITGISARHVERPEIPASEMALAAAEKIFIPGGLKKEEIDFLLVVTQSADYRLPCTACILQDKLGLKTSAGALDVNLGCSGYVYGLVLAKALVRSRAASKVLLVAVEKSSALVHPSDVTLRNILGDAAAATVISRDRGFAEIGESDFGTDGSGWHHIQIPAGGTAIPCSDKTKAPVEDQDGILRYPEYERMNGMEVFNFSIKRGPQTIQAAVEKNATTLDRIDFFLLHQANKIIIDTITQSMNIPSGKVPVNIAEVGNTSSCSIPILLSDLKTRGELKPGNKLLLCGFGVGLSWGSTVLAIA